jgi:hypothetical protein
LWWEGGGASINWCKGTSLSVKEGRKQELLDNCQ